MTQYKFDMKIGHYVVINEGEVPAENQGSQEQNQTQEKAALKNLQTEEINQLEKDKLAKLDSMQKDIDKMQENILQIQNKIAEAQGNEETSQQQLNDLQKQLIQAKYDLEVKKFDKAKEEADRNKVILDAQKKLLEAMHMKFTMPKKYRNLSESNIHNAKIYLNKLVQNDDEHILKGMTDFKRAFGTSELLYGKDKEGFFAVCIDENDFNKLNNTLEEVGYLRDEIIDTIMPQLFDRKEMAIE